MLTYFSGVLWTTLCDPMDHSPPGPSVHGILQAKILNGNNYGVIGEGNGNPLQYSCLENPMDRQAWRAIIYRVTKSQT